jgi:hypothetical protein
LKFTHSVYGLKLSTEELIPGLEPIETPGPCDVDVRFSGSSPVFEDRLFARDLYYTDWRSGELDRPALLVWRSPEGDSFRFAYSDGTEFVLEPPAGRIWARWPEPITFDDTVVYLLGPILGYWLRLQEIACLHASAIAVDGRAIAFLGPAHAGKSTTAAFFAQRGYPVLSEDIVALREEGEAFLVAPGYPLLRLWPRSVRHLYGTPTALPRMTPNYGKCYLDLRAGGDGFHRDPLPLAAIYLLGERLADPAMPAVEAVPPAAGLMSLVANTYTNYLLDPAARAQEFQALARLIGRIPLRRVTPHADATFLPQLCDAILDDYRKMSSRTSL